jgi:hypothetical protein
MYAITIWFLVSGCCFHFLKLRSGDERTWKSHCVQVVIAQHLALMWSGKICLCQSSKFVTECG